MNEPASSTRPVLWTTLRPVNSDSEELRRALSKLRKEDASFRVDEEDVDGQTVIRVMSELQLENICERLAREHNVYVDCRKPEIIYLETIRDISTAEGKFINQSGGRGHYAHLVIRIEPNPTKEYEVVNEMPEQAIPKKYVLPAEQGIGYAMKAGVVAGYETVDVKVILCDGSYHDIDSDEEAFESAGFIAMWEALRQANPVLLEPLMSLEVVVPEEWAGSVLGDLQGRGAEITGMESRAGEMVVHAIVRLAVIIGYSTDLREMTQERATCSVALLRYTEAQGLPSAGDDRIGVTANKPWKPKPKRGTAAVEPPLPESDT